MTVSVDCGPRENKQIAQEEHLPLFCADGIHDVERIGLGLESVKITFYANVDRLGAIEYRKLVAVLVLPAAYIKYGMVYEMLQRHDSWRAMLTDC